MQHDEGIRQNIILQPLCQIRFANVLYGMLQKSILVIVCCGVTGSPGVV